MFTGISLVDILNHSGMGVGMITFSSKVTMRGENVFLVNTCNILFIDDSYSNYNFRRFNLLFPSNTYAN